MVIKILRICFILIFPQLIFCNKKTNANQFLEVGKNIAIQSKTELGKNLMNAIKSNGTAGAIVFCNSKAMPLTNELSNKFKVQIKRVSDKARNPVNQANEAETKIIETFKMQLVNNESLKPVSVESETNHIGYYPIETNSMCLQCHGEKGKDISKEVSMKLDILYPKDLATGYTDRQIRGMWVIEKLKE